MKTLVERIAHVWKVAETTDEAIDIISELAAEHNAVMAKMAEALKLYDAEFDRLYSGSHGRGLFNRDGERLDNQLTNESEKTGVAALAAFNSLGEK